MKNILLKYFFGSFILLPARGATHRCLVQKPCSLSFSPGQGFTGHTIPLRNMMSAVPLLMHNLYRFPRLGVCRPSLPTNPDSSLSRGSFREARLIFIIIAFLFFILYAPHALSM